MAIRKLLLPLPGPAGGEAALATALMVARMWRAHLSVLHVRVNDQRAHAVRALFNEFVAANDVPVGDATAGGPAVASFAWMTGREAEQVVHHARLADLTVLPHPEAGEDVSSSDTLHAILFNSGRPVLVAPPVAPRTIGTRICIAWNGTAESASAVYALTPWIKRAEAVRILYAEGYQRRGPPAGEVAEYLALHGVTADLQTFPPGTGPVGAGVLSAAEAFGADLLGMGAYSHSRLRQLILGGVTRHVLTNSKLSVIMNR